jgi:hypothetical protein
MATAQLTFRAETNPSLPGRYNVLDEKFRIVGWVEKRGDTWDGGLPWSMDTSTNYMPSRREAAEAVHRLWQDTPDAERPAAWRKS